VAQQPWPSPLPSFLSPRVGHDPGPVFPLSPAIPRALPLFSLWRVGPTCQLLPPSFFPLPCFLPAGRPLCRCPWPCSTVRPEPLRRTRARALAAPEPPFLLEGRRAWIRSTRFESAGGAEAVARLTRTPRLPHPFSKPGRSLALPSAATASPSFPLCPSAAVLPLDPRTAPPLRRHDFAPAPPISDR
jgi:hypothetical protein